MELRWGSKNTTQPDCIFVAERERFELSVPCGTPPFQDGALDRYATSPSDRQYIPPLPLTQAQNRDNVYSIFIESHGTKRESVGCATTFVQILGADKVWLRRTYSVRRSQTQKATRDMDKLGWQYSTGCGAAVARLHGVQEAVGSIPASPTTKESLYGGSFALY